MASLCPPDPPRMEGISNDGSMPGLAGPLTSPNDGQPSGLAILFTRSIADKGNFTANGELIINQMTVEMIQILIRSEQNRAEADKRRDDRTQEMANQIEVMANQISNLVQMQNPNPMTTSHPLPARGTNQPTYAERKKIKSTDQRPPARDTTANEGWDEIVPPRESGDPLQPIEQSDW